MDVSQHAQHLINLHSHSNSPLSTLTQPATHVWNPFVVPALNSCIVPSNLSNNLWIPTPLPICPQLGATTSLSMRDAKRPNTTAWHAVKYLAHRG